MRTFEIQYVSRCREQKDYCCEIIEARSETSALRKFAKMFGIKDYRQLLDDSFDWWHDLEWLCSFRSINEVDEVICPRCNGIGKVNNRMFVN